MPRSSTKKAEKQQHQENNDKGFLLHFARADIAKNDEFEALLKHEGFEVETVTSAAQAIETLVRCTPKVFLHRFDACALAESTKIHRTIDKSAAYQSVVRILLAHHVDQQLLAFANDYNIDRVVPDELLETELIEVIKAACKDRDEETEFMSFFDSSGTSEYDQESLNVKILELIKTFPENPRVKLEYGSYLVRSGSLDEAETYSKKLLEADPQNVRAMNLLARVYLKQKRFNRALEILKSADFMSPDNPERLVMIGDALYEKGNFKEAKESYERVVQIEPESRDGQNGLGMVYVSLGDAEKALQCFKKCLSEDETASFFNNAAVLAIKSNKTMEGLKLYETALKALQTDSYAHIIFYNIALALFRIEEHEQAVEAVKASLQYKPDYARARKLLEKLLNVAS